MRNDSPLFDRIRVKPDKDRRLHAQCPACEWPDCKGPATHRAPKGRLREREYWQFCLEHVRQYLIATGQLPSDRLLAAPTQVAANDTSGTRRVNFTLK